MSSGQAEVKALMDLLKKKKEEIENTTKRLNQLYEEKKAIEGQIKSAIAQQNLAPAGRGKPILHMQQAPVGGGSGTVMAAAATAAAPALPSERSLEEGFLNSCVDANSSEAKTAAAAAAVAASRALGGNEREANSDEMFTEIKASDEYETAEKQALADKKSREAQAAATKKAAAAAAGQLLASGLHADAGFVDDQNKASANKKKRRLGKDNGQDD